jgi:4'-phosphopantetheinyl transferase
MQPPIEWSAAPAELTLSSDEISIWITELDRDQGVVKNLEQILSPEEKVRAARFHFVRDRDRFVVGRGTLRRLLGAYSKLAPEGLRFHYGPQGKPSLDTRDGGSPVYFNLAHTKGLALYAFALTREVGIDLEFIQADFSVEEIARRYFSKSEYDELLALPAECRAEAFFLCWTRKEAYIKARGEGLHIDLKNFDVTLAPNRPARFAGGVESRWQLETFFAAKHCPAAVVYEAPPCSLRYISY